MNRWFVATIFLALTHSSILAQAPRPSSRQPVVLTEEAKRLHLQAVVVDGHNDLPYVLRDKAESGFEKFDIAKRLNPKDFHTDIHRLREGNVGVQFWSAYVPSSTVKTKTAAHDTLEQIDLIHRMVARYPETFEMVHRFADVARIRKAGKIASMIGVEGGHSIENSLAILRDYHRLGVKYMTLTHSESVDWADSATDEPKSNGLSPFGKEVVREMNRLGMLVDISHVSVKTMKDALATSQAPVIASHSSAYAVAQHPRNVPDEVLRELPRNGGVVMVNFFSGFVVPEGARAMAKMFEVYRQVEKQYTRKEDVKAAMERYRQENPFPAGTIHHLIDHIDHIVKVAGVDHVGLGSDYDGILKTPQQLEDVSTYPLITQELKNRGYSDEAVLKILGGNALRVLEQAEQVADKVAGKRAGLRP